MQVKTITTAAGVNEIDFGNDNSQSTAHFYWLKNLGASTLYVSANPNPIAEKDDVAELPAKGAVSVETDEGKIYVLGAGKVEIHRTNSKFCPFDWQSSGSDITASGNPVQLDGLQDDAPFSEIVVSGKNLMPFPYYDTTKTVNGVTYTVNGDGTITMNGTSTDKSYFYFMHDVDAKIYHAGKYTISGMPKNSIIDLRVLNIDDSAIIAQDIGNGASFELTKPAPLRIYLYFSAGKTFDNVIIYPQLELGDTATDYEPPITGRELQVNASGKNLLPAMSNSVTRNGVTYTVNANGTITLNGTAEKADGVDVITKTPLKAGVYTLSGCPEGGSGTSFALRAGLGTTNTLYGRDYGNGLKITAETDTVITVTIQNAEIGRVFDNFVFRPQLELGDTATEYEPYHGSVTTITPTSNPYTIPDSIRQQEKYNVISVSEGELSVVGVQKNAAIKRIWDDMGMDLLFDGLALLASPAENIDLGNYSKYLINCYYDPNAVSKGYCISIVVEYDRLKNIVDKAGALIHSLSTSYALELHFSGIMDNANYYAKQANAESAAYYTRIYGIK